MAAAVATSYFWRLLPAAAGAANSYFRRLLPLIGVSTGGCYRRKWLLTAAVAANRTHYRRLLLLPKATFGDYRRSYYPRLLRLLLLLLSAAGCLRLLLPRCGGMAATTSGRCSGRARTSCDGFRCSEDNISIRQHSAQMPSSLLGSSFVLAVGGQRGGQAFWRRGSKMQHSGSTSCTHSSPCCLAPTQSSPCICTVSLWMLNIGASGSTSKDPLFGSRTCGPFLL